MQNSKSIYTSREEAEALLKQTLEGGENKNSKTKDGKASSKKKKWISRVIYGMLLLAMFTMLGKVWYQKLNDETPSLFGYQVYVVETGSMIPTLPVGTNILVRQLRDGDELKVRDIVTYIHNDATITHRIIELVTGEDGVLRYQTQGG